jgi:cyclin B
MPSAALIDITNVSSCRSAQAYGKTNKSLPGQAPCPEKQAQPFLPPPRGTTFQVLSVKGSALEDITLSVFRDANGSAGFSFMDDDLTVSRIEKDRFAELPHLPLLQVGDIIVAVNGVNVKETSQFSREAKGALRFELTVRRACVQVDLGNVQGVPLYSSEIYNRLFRDESRFLAWANYMELQADINGKMRAILIDWLIEVHMKYKMRDETLFLTVNLIDRFLSKQPVMRKRLQLVGVVAMFIASKFEEINPPEISDFVHITDNAYTKQDVIAMECMMLTVLDFEVVVPMATHFVERLQRAGHCDERHVSLVEYVIELGLLDMRMLRYPPSHVVAAAFLLSNDLLGKQPAWSASMAQHARFTEQALRDCAGDLRQLLDTAPKSQLQAVQKKFSTSKYHMVSRMDIFFASSPSAPL